MPTFPERTALFRQLHADNLLLLANAWDAGTARLFESLGASASATTSAGLAWAQGYPDGDRLPVSRLFESIAAITRVLDTPLTVDIEGGYSDEPDTVADTVLQLVRQGVSGINLEDGGDDPGLLCAKIARIRERCRDAGVDVFINARTDVYLRRLAPAGVDSVRETLQRAGRYRQAGTDGLFVPGVVEESEIAAIAEAAGLPLNILWRASLPDRGRLRQLGVRRLSAGSFLAESAAGHLRHHAQAFLGEGPGLSADPRAMTYGELNALFASV